MWDSCIENGIATLRCAPIAINLIIKWAMIFSGVVAVVLIVFAGIKFMTSGGDPLKVSGARKTMTFAILGLVLLLMCFVALKVISNITGVECDILGINMNCQ